MVVTGANAGLGFETTKKLAQENATVILICRSQAKGNSAIETILQDHPDADLHLVTIDLASQTAIRAGAISILDKWPKIDVLVNNAATITSNYSQTEDGLETQFAVNHLAYFLFIHCLLPGLYKSKEARIVNISSGNHRRGYINFDDLGFKKNYHIFKAYNQSKLANLLFTYELHRRLQKNGLYNISVNAVDPGTNFTDIGIKKTSFLHKLAWKIRRLYSLPPSEGAATQVYLAQSPDVGGVSGKFWYKKQPIQSSSGSYDLATAKKLWLVSMSLCKIEDYFNLHLISGGIDPSLAE